MSVWNQDYKNIEIIIVDNNSSDSTIKIIEELKNEDKDLIVVKEERQGASYARNKGLSLATGEYVQFLDSDDELFPAKIKHQVELIKNAKIKPDIIAAAYVTSEKKVITVEQDTWKGLIKTRLGCTCSNLWKKETVELAGGWNVAFKSSQETELMFRMMKAHCSVLNDTKALTLVNVRSTGRISTTNRAGNWTTYCDLRKEIIEFLSTHKIPFNVSEFYQFLFDSLRILNAYDEAASVERWEKYFPKSFKVGTSPSTGRFYLFLYKIFGFKYAQKVRRTFK